jgi:hypothetical protein
MYVVPSSDYTNDTGNTRERVFAIVHEIGIQSDEHVSLRFAKLQLKFVVLVLIPLLCCRVNASSFGGDYAMQGVDWKAHARPAGAW